MSDPIPVRTAYAGWAAAYDHDPNPNRDLDAVALRAASLPLDGADVLVPRLAA